MQEMLKRALLYGSAVLVLGGLGVAISRSHADADVMTLLSSADVQLRMAYAIPAVDKQGAALTSREDMIVAAEQHLQDVERLQPGMAVTAEFRGFAHMLRGRYREAAACYELAQRCRDCQDEQRDILAFNQARMLASAGDRQQALIVFERHAEALDRRFGHQRRLEEAEILRELGQREAAERRLDQVARDAAAPPMASLQAGVEYLELGHAGKAEAVLRRAAEQVPIANYHLARLKLQGGEVDSSMELLERAFETQPAEVRRRLRDEAAVWSAVVGNFRFQQVSGSAAAAPPR